jgi:holin-like protein
MLSGLTILLVFQLIGEVIAYFTGGLVPGPVIGMALAFLTLMLTHDNARAESFRNVTIGAATILIANLGVLFVPAGVGVGQHLDILISDGVGLAVTILVSTALTLICTVWAFLMAKRYLGGAA